MHYYTHNIGEFAAKTRFLTPEQIGIYVILKDEYFANGMRIACDRIANLMPLECETSLRIVLKRFFTERDGFYVCQEFDEELASFKDRGSINAENAKKRWAKKRVASELSANSCESHANVSEAHAKPCLTNNQEPITNNQEPVEVAAQEKVEKEAKRSKREPTVSFPDELPDEWRTAALSIRRDITPERVFLKLRGRYAPTTTKKTMGNWRKIFLGWIGREYPESSQSKTTVPDHKNTHIRFDEDYYADAKKPDGSIDWGI